MKKATLREKLKYQFDKIMAKGMLAVIGLLVLITLLVVLIASLGTMLFTQGEMAPLNVIWLHFIHAVDSGALSSDQGEFSFMLMMTISTLVGIFITSALISILTSGVNKKIMELRKGKSKVIEEDHIVILGFNDNIYSMLGELIIANENKRKATVVVLGNRDVEEMEDLIKVRFPHTGPVNIICRRGDSWSMEDLSICSLPTCHSIIINENDDFKVIKTILAASNLLNKEGATNTKAHIVAMIHHASNIDSAKIAGEGRAVILHFNGVIARIIAHSCDHPGMSIIFKSLFDFKKADIYLEELPQLYGKKLLEIIGLFEKGTVMGIDRKGTCHLNPGMDIEYKQGEKLIVLAPNSGVAPPDEAAPQIDDEAVIKKRVTRSVPQKERILFLGCNDLLPEIVQELDRYCPKHSTVMVAAKARKVEGLEYHTQNIEVKTRACDIYDHNILRGFAEEGYEHIVLLSDTDSSADEADAKTLLILLHLRNLVHKKDYNFSITSEMRNVYNQQLAKVANVNDFIISSNLTSMLTVQLAEDKRLYRVFEELLDETKAEIYFRHVSDFVEIHEPIKGYTLYKALAQKGHVMLGYKRFLDKNNDFEICLNPHKNKEVLFGPFDVLIILA